MNCHFGMVSCLRDIDGFIRWAKSSQVRRGLICHFYIKESDKQYYGKTDFAYFNLYSDSRDWLVKGTPKHGISSQRKKRSPIPCLNCFEVNEVFYKDLKKLDDTKNEKFDFGLILNKRKLRSQFGIIDVSIHPPNPLPPPENCHHYDWARQRVKVLAPFNDCDVVRIKIEPEPKQLPITTIPHGAIMGLLVRKRRYRQIAKLIKHKCWEGVEIFPVL